MTLMERLASMSPAEDAKKAKIILEEETNVHEDENNDTFLQLRRSRAAVSCRLHGDSR